MTIEEFKTEYNNKFVLFIEEVLAIDDDSTNFFVTPENITEILGFESSFNPIIINLNHIYHIDQIPKDKLRDLSAKSEGFIDALIQYRRENPV